jgi:iron complex outermembrane recepter protein
LQNTINAGIDKNFKTVLKGLNFAMGLEQRFEQYEIHSGDLASYESKNGGLLGSQCFPGLSKADELNATRNVFGAYLDLELDVTKKWTVAGALRFENYSDFGNTLNGKFATRLDVTDKFAIRGTVSTGYRAPSLVQKHYGQTVNNYLGSEPAEMRISKNGGPIANGFGIDTLRQETSLNYSAGISLKPTKGLSITLDGYLIKVKDRIIFTGIFDTSDVQVGAIIKNLGNGVTYAQSFANAVSTNTKGLDFIVDYNVRKGKHKFNAILAANYNILTIDNVNVPNKVIGVEDSFVNTADVIAKRKEQYFDIREQQFLKFSAPRTKASLQLEYGIKIVTIMARITHFGEVLLAGWNTYSTTDNPTEYGNFHWYAPKTTVDLSLGLALTKQINLSLGVNNLMNIYPDMQGTKDTENGGAWDPVQMGNNGRFYFAKVRFNFLTNQKEKQVVVAK